MRDTLQTQNLTIKLNLTTFEGELLEQWRLSIDDLAGLGGEALLIEIRDEIRKLASRMQAAGERIQS